MVTSSVSSSSSVLNDVLAVHVHLLPSPTLALGQDNMPVKFAAPPPPTPPNAIATSSKSMATAVPNSPNLPQLPRSHNHSASRDDSGSEISEKLKAGLHSREDSVCVTLDCPSIGDVMAARLAICVLDHMLYLKSQIPFPVPQLMKMSATSTSTSKGKRKLDSLLSSFDLLSSHLGTTFTALSTALARAQSGEEGDQAQSTAHFAILFGPTVSAASTAASTRARIMLEITGFDAKIWGTRDDEEEECEGNSKDEEKEGEGEVPPDSDEEEDGSVAEESEEESEEEVPPSPEPSDDEDDGDEDDSCAPSSSSYVPSEQDIVSAERTLSRALAQANADTAAGMASEIPPTQVHILIRAPRRFKHPAWRPHQQSGVSRALDIMISEPTPSKSKPGKKPKDHLIRVRCHSPDEVAVSYRDTTTEEDEENETIWWSWDAGKLEGFSDW